VVLFIRLSFILYFVFFNYLIVPFNAFLHFLLSMVVSSNIVLFLNFSKFIQELLFLHFLWFCNGTRRRYLVSDLLQMLLHELIVGHFFISIIYFFAETYNPRNWVFALIIFLITNITRSLKNPITILRVRITMIILLTHFPRPNTSTFLWVRRFN